MNIECRICFENCLDTEVEILSLSPLTQFQNMINRLLVQLKRMMIYDMRKNSETLKRKQSTLGNNF